MEVVLNNTSLTKGEPGLITVSCNGVQQYSQIQFEIYDTGVGNTSSRLGYGLSPRILKPDTYQAELSTQHLDCGVYEVKLIRFHSSLEEVPETPYVDFVGGRNYERLFFEVIPIIQLPRNKDDIMQGVIDKEEGIEKDFLSDTDIRSDKSKPKIGFCVFVFIKGLLLGTKMRLNRYEIFPVSKGIDTKDFLECTNDFMKNETAINITFNYEEGLKQRSRNENPVCVAHFPNIIASDSEEAKRYCKSKTAYMVKALSLIRDAGGEIFDVVVYNRENSTAKRFTSTTPYRGNLLTGSLSGENPDTLESYSLELERYPFKNFLVNLYKEAKQETSTDFQYVRYWQILETLAESRNYNKDDDLTDFEGNIIGSDGKALEKGEASIKKKGSVNIVYALFVEYGHGASCDMWKNVNIWFSFRNSVAHHGSILEYQKLSRKKTRDWAVIGMGELQSSGGHDPVLWRLKEDVKLILRKMIISN